MKLDTHPVRCEWCGREYVLGQKLLYVDHPVAGRMLIHWVCLPAVEDSLP